MTEVEQAHRWAVRLPTGEQVKLIDLPWALVTDAAASLKVGWASLCERPLDGPGVLARGAYRTACNAYGIKPASMTVRAMAAACDTVPDGPPTLIPEGDLQ